MLGIGVEGRQVDDVVQPAPAGFQDGLEIGERQSHLRFKVWFGRAVAATTDLAGYEQQVS